MRRYASLRGRREFALVLRRGRPSSGAHLVIFTLVPNKPRAPLVRVGIVITKKVGTAVERNRLRRRAKAVLDGALGARGAWYVLQFRPSAAALSFDRLASAIAAGLAAASTPAGERARPREATRR